MPTIIDVAREAEVSTATVSRVINNSFLVTEEKRQRVLEAMRKVGYVPADRTRSPREGVGHLIVVLTSMFNTQMLGAVDRSARELGYGTATVFVGDAPGDIMEANATLQLLEGKVAGLLLVNFFDKDNTEFIQTVLPRYKVVQVGEFTPLAGQNYCVSSDDYQAAYDLTTHLLEQGRRRIAIFATQNAASRMYFEKQRINGYRAALLDHGITPEEELVRYTDFTPEGAAYATRKMLRTMGDRLPDAVYCVCDGLAMGCLKVLHDAGVSVPGQIAVAGMDGLEASEYLSPTLTSIRQDFGQIGSEAVHLLHEVIQGRVQGGRKIYVPHQLMIRGSTCAAAERNLYTESD